MNISDAVLNRRTTRIFKQEAIDKDCIKRMIDFARMSPSAGNIQSLKYLIIDSLHEREAIFPHVKYASYIDGWSPLFSESPVAFIAVLNDKAIRPNNSLTQCDCGIAMMTISLVAIEMGLDSCILGAIDRNEIANILGISSEYEVLYLVGLGVSNQSNIQVDDSESVKYTMDEFYNFTVPKRKLEDVLLEKNK